MKLQGRTQSWLSIAALLLPTTHAAILYEGATVITFDDAADRLQVLQNASLLMEGDTITRVSEGSLSATLPGNTQDQASIGVDTHFTYS